MDNDDNDNDDTIILDFGNNNNNISDNFNLNNNINIDTPDDKNFNKYRNANNFQNFNQGLFEETNKKIYKSKPGNFDVNFIEFLDKIAKIQSQNEIFKLVDAIAGRLGVNINIFKTNKYDIIKQSIDKLSNIKPLNYINSNTIDVDARTTVYNIPAKVVPPKIILPESKPLPPFPQPKPSPPVSPVTKTQFISSNSNNSNNNNNNVITPNIVPKLYPSNNINNNIGVRNFGEDFTTLKLNNLPKDIIKDIDNLDDLFEYNNISDYGNAVTFLKNLQIDREQRLNIFFNYHMYIYENINVCFNTLFTSNLNSILNIFKKTILNNLDVDLEPKNIFAELLNKKYSTDLIDFFVNYYKLNIIKLTSVTERNQRIQENAHILRSILIKIQESEIINTLKSNLTTNINKYFDNQ